MVRISSALSTAQLAAVRETGLKMAVIQDPTNDWEYIAGVPINADIYEPSNAGFNGMDVEWYRYRAGAGICVLSNGNIVRVRNGNGSTQSDRQIYVQEITDPTDPAQWTSWSVLYSGTHYGQPEIMANGTNYVVYHAKSGGLYRNNSLVLTPRSSSYKFLRFHPVRNQLDAGWPVNLFTDPDGDRAMEADWVDDVTSPSIFGADYSHFRHYSAAVAGWKVGSQIHRVQFGPLYADARSHHKDSLWHQIQTSLTDRELTAPQLLRGLGGAGLITFEGIFLYQFSDGYYYLFTGEYHDQIVDGEAQPMHNLNGLIPTWSRSKDLVHWTQPVIGPAAQGVDKIAGVVERSGYLYWADNGQVWRRPLASTTTQIENYVKTVEFDMPRDNQAASGTAEVANPAGTNDWLLDQSDQEIQVQPGLKVADGSFEFADFNRFFLRYCNREVEGEVSRIKLNFGDIWTKLERTFKDTYNFVGQLNWSDWAKGKRNQPFNYYFATDSTPKVNDFYQLITTGDVLFTGWRGHNFDMSVKIGGFDANPAILARYKDSKNYIKFFIFNDHISLYEIKAGVATFQRSWGITRTKPFTFRLVMKWNRYDLYFNGSLIGSDIRRWSTTAPGYVGFTCKSPNEFYIWNFTLQDWEFDYTLANLIKTALAFADFHDVQVNGGTEKAYAIVWGPQTDVPTPAEAIRQLMASLKMQLAYRGGIITASEFTDKTVIHDLEDTILETKQEQEDKRRLNVAIVDGNEHSYTYIDTKKLIENNVQVLEYFDVPELTTLEAVIQRAIDEITNSNKTSEPGGTALLLFDLWRGDYIRWTDNLGVTKKARVEGLSVDINQSTEPSQHMDLDLSQAVEEDVMQSSGVASAEVVNEPFIAIKNSIYPSGIASAGTLGTPTRA